MPLYASGRVMFVVLRMQHSVGCRIPRSSRKARLGLSKHHGHTSHRASTHRARGSDRGLSWFSWLLAIRGCEHWYHWCNTSRYHRCDYRILLQASSTLLTIYNIASPTRPTAPKTQEAAFVCAAPPVLLAVGEAAALLPLELPLADVELVLLGLPEIFSWLTEIPVPFLQFVL